MEPSKITVETLAEFTFNVPRQRVIARLVGMPISDPGAYKLKLWVREKTATPKEWREAGSFPLQITFKPATIDMN